MKKTLRYLDCLPDKALIPMLEAVEYCGENGFFKTPDTSGLSFVVEMLKREVPSLSAGMPFAGNLVVAECVSRFAKMVDKKS